MKEFAENLRKKLIESYDAKGLRASGSYEDSLDVSLKYGATSTSLVVRGAMHSFFMENGRKKSEKAPPLDAIKQWINDKNITLKENQTETSLAFAIMHKIKTVGIPVPNSYNKGGVISDVLDETLKSDFAKVVGQEFLEKEKIELFAGFDEFYKEFKSKKEKS